MRIGIDATPLYGRFGGIENALWQTLQALYRLDTHNHYHIFVPFDTPAAFFEAPHPRWHWHRLPFRGQEKVRRILWQQLEVPLLIKREHLDLWHGTNYVLPLLAPIPTVLTLQDLIALNRPRFALRANRLHYRAIMPRSLKKACRILVTTPRGQREVHRRVPTAQVRVVPLGVESEFFEPVPAESLAAIQQKYQLPARFLLYVGNLEPKKNLPNLLRAIKLLGPQAPPLVLVGGIKPWPELERQLQGTRFLGFVPREDLPPLYAAASVFCFPSLCEGFGLPVLEALACGARVVASSQVPLPNLASVAQTPNPRFPRAIAQAIATALEEPYPNEAGRNYARPFTWEATAQATLTAYRELGAA